MALPIVQSTQATPGAGTPGEGRNDLVVAEVVNLSDTEAANGSATYLWTLEDAPIGSATVLANAATPTPSFTPDIAGSYRVNCLVDGSATDTEVFAVPLPNTGARIPSFDEDLQYDEGGNAKGWHEAQDQFMRAVDAGIGGVRQLIDFIDDGPAEGFASGAFTVVTPATAFPTSVIWYVVGSVPPAGKIVEQTVTYNANKTINTSQWKMYDTDGATIKITVTDTISYSGIFETGRTRTIV